MASRLTHLLNSCKSGNLPAADQKELSDLMTDYFTADSPCNEDDLLSDSESDSEAEEGLDDCEMSDGEIDEPLVHVDETRGCGASSMDVDAAPDDGGMLEKARTRCCKANGQGCKQIKVPGPAPGDTRRGCITQFQPEEIVALQLSIQDMTRDAKDWLILGILSSCMRRGEKTECSRWKEQHDRQRVRSSYVLLTRPVCKDAFLYLLGISQDKLTYLSKHFQANGLALPQRRAGGRKSNTRSLTFDDTARAVRFIKNFAEDHAVCLPGRVPGFKREDIRLMPSSFPKSRVYRAYKDSALTNGHRVVSKSSFGQLWKDLCPYIVVARPMSDLCWRCQRNNTKIYRSAKLTHEEKSELILEQQAHLSQVDAERQLYKQMSADAKDVVRQQGLQQLQPTPANSGDFAMHYSFDFAQQVHYPSDAAQPGPLYFLTPRKCGIFGVHCEGLSQQVNFLIDEAVSSSKGSNAVISYLHYFFSNYSLGEKIVHLHCDNCAGQNKNRWVLFYFAWRVQQGLHSAVTINFMPPGHTKFAPDWCFGLVKRCFRRSHVSCLEDLQDVVRESTPESGVNIPQLVGREDATVFVPTYDWQAFFTPAYKTLPGIKPVGHFRFDVQHPGKVFYKTTIADAEKEMLLARPNHVNQLPPMPAIVPAPGLSRDRQQYLYQSIREFVRHDQRDVVCPPPRN